MARKAAATVAGSIRLEQMLPRNEATLAAAHRPIS